MKKILLLFSVFAFLLVGCVQSSNDHQYKRDNKKEYKAEHTEKAYADAGNLDDAKRVVAYAKNNNWRAQSGYVGGRQFENREHRLPLRGDHYDASALSFKEYDVNPKERGQGRDAERVIIALHDGIFYKAYYTADHYKTFTEIN